MQDSIFYLIIGIAGAGLGFFARKKHITIGKASFISAIETAMNRLHQWRTNKWI